MVGVARDLARREGAGGFYKGFHYSAMQSATEKAIYFFGYTNLLKAWEALYGPASPAMRVVLGSVAEWIHLPVTLPIDTVTVRIQTGNGKEGPLGILWDIISKSGLAGLYRGWEAYIVLCLKPALTYAIFDKLKALLLKRRAAGGGKAAALTVLEAFVIGAIARGIATIVVFPYTRAKVIVKAHKPVAGERPPSIAGTVARILRHDGFLALFQGCVPEVSRGVLSAALMLAAKEKIAVAARAALALPPQ